MENQRDDWEVFPENIWISLENKYLFLLLRINFLSPINWQRLKDQDSS
jgi:hypothetical protein